MANKGRRNLPVPEVNLPSYGLNLLDGDKTQEILARIQNNQGPFSHRPAETMNSLVTQMSAPQSTAGPSGIQPSDNHEIQVFVQDTDDYEETVGQFAAATEPIVTVEASDLMEDSKMEPELRANLRRNYMRFRYMSEKNSKKKGPKARNYDDFDTCDEKNTLADIELLNYTGAAKIVAYCVDADGKVHPYNLFGDNCHNGVFVYRSKFRPGKTMLKLKKVSVTTPKAKEYEGNQKCQTAYLREVGITDMKFCREVRDKQLVYIKVMAILEDKNDETLSVITKPLINKKKGEEFKIEDVEPVTAPACGLQTNNSNKNRIIAYVTEKTAFPSEVGVKIRERDQAGIVRWEENVDSDQITVIKQCVVRFVPPAYRNPHVIGDVEVEMCLYDKMTLIETDPVILVYKGSDGCDRCALGPLPKKRKLNGDDYLADASSSFDAEGTSRHVKSLLRSFSKESTPNSEGESNNEETMVSEQEEKIFSLANNDVPFSNYSPGWEEMTDPLLDPTGSVLVTSVSTHATSYQMPVYQTAVAGTSTTNAHQQGTSQTLSASQQMPRVSVSQTQQQQQSEISTIAPSTATVTSGQSNSNEYVVQEVQQSGAGPKLTIALINGKVFFVNDDTGDNAVANQSIQNIGEQQVIVQSLPPQHPSGTDEQSDAILATSAGEIMGNQTTMSGSETIQQPIENIYLPQQQQQQQQQQQLQQQLLNQQVQSQFVLQNMLQLIKQQPTPELQAQMVQTLLSGSIGGDMAIQANQQVLSPLVMSNLGATGTEGESYSMDLEDDDVEIDGEPEEATAECTESRRNNAIPTCVEEVTMVNDGTKNNQHNELKFRNGTFS